MKRYRIPLAALAVAAAVVVPARVASAGTGLTGCTVTFSNATIYKTDGGVSNPTSSTATIDVSGTAVKPASFFFHVADSSGHHTTSIEQTSSTSIDYNRTWLQWIGDASGGTYFTTTEPLAVDVIVANSDVWGQPYICYGTLTLMPDGAPSAPSGVSAVAGQPRGDGVVDAVEELLRPDLHRHLQPGRQDLHGDLPHDGVCGGGADQRS